MSSGDAALQDVRTVCLFLGPYRNLTTLTASMLFLHPHCQALNHAGLQVFQNPKLNFIADYTRERFENFCLFAWRASHGGGPGTQGGSIAFGHAFSNHPKMARTYRSRYGEELVKAEIRSLVWKESMMTSNVLRRQGVDVGALLEQCPKLRFMMPIRNPVDCAISNQSTGLARTLGLSPEAEVAEVLDRVVEEMGVVLGLAERYPERFFYYFQEDLAEPMLRSLADFLQLDQDTQWLTDALHVADIKDSYPVDTALRAAYESAVDAHIRDAGLAARFRAMVAG